jgi:hypothetical protein
MAREPASTITYGSQAFVGPSQQMATKDDDKCLQGHRMISKAENEK